MNQPIPHSGARRANSATRNKLLALLWLAPFVFTPMALASSVANAEQSYPLVAQAGAQVSSSEAADTVQQTYGGRVLKVETSRDNGGTVYRVKILQDDGRIRTVSVDGQSGRILE